MPARALDNECGRVFLDCGINADDVFSRQHGERPSEPFAAKRVSLGPWLVATLFAFFVCGEIDAFREERRLEDAIVLHVAHFSPVLLDDRP